MQALRADTEKITMSDMTKELPEAKDPPVKVPKKRGRKPKHVPMSHTVVFYNRPIVIEFD